MPPVEEKSMVPTVLVGVGGTGHEVLSRVRRLIEDTYGSLDNFPIISFLIIDTGRFSQSVLKTVYQFQSHLQYGFSQGVL